MKFSKKLSDVLWAMAENYLASLPEAERNQILREAAKNCEPSTSKQVTLSINS